MADERRISFDVVALEGEDAVDLMVTLSAQGEQSPGRAVGRHLQVVLDIGETMHPRKLFPALRGIDYLLGRLEEDDTFGLVTFGASTRVAFPAGPAGDGDAVREVLGEIRPFGLADPTSGLLMGIRECQRIAAPESSIVIVSDADLRAGGRKETHIIRGMAGGSKEQGFTVSTVCMDGKPGPLLGQIARAGGGRAGQASDGGGASRALIKALPGLAEKPFKAVSLTVRAWLEVEQFSIPQNWPSFDHEEGITFELGDMDEGDFRGLDFHLEIPGLADLGHHDVAEVEAQWTDCSTRRTESARTSVWVNIPKEEPAGGEIEYGTKMDFPRPRPAQESSEGAPDGSRAQRRTPRPERPRRKIPKALEERVSEIAREQATLEVERLLRQADGQSQDESGHGQPECGEEQTWPDGESPREP